MTTSKERKLIAGIIHSVRSGRSKKSVVIKQSNSLVVSAPENKDVCLPLVLGTKNP